MTNPFDKSDTRTPADQKLDNSLGEDSVPNVPTGGPNAPDTPAVQSLEQEQEDAPHQTQEDELNEALEESFPASDPISQISRTTSTQRDSDPDSNS